MQRLATLALAVAFLISPLSASAEPLTCKCVQWLREARGINIRGDANTLIPSKSLLIASEGDVLLTSEGGGHAAEIMGFEGQIDMGTYLRPLYIKVLEANYHSCQVSTRLIPWDSPSIKGIY